MTYYDISLPLSPSLPEWPGQQKFIREETRTSAIVSALHMSSHFGTHIDAPKHFLFSKAGVDKTPLAALIGAFHIFAIDAPNLINFEHIKKLPIKPGDRILFKTRNSKLRGKKIFTPHYVSLGLDAANYLVDKKIALVGIDYFGIEAKSAPGHPVHRTLLSQNIVIVEGLNLSNITPGTYQGAILPINIKDGDGAPARAILWK